MKIIKLIRPALDPRRELELRMRECQSGMADFVQAMAPPAGWLQVEILAETPAETAISEFPRAISRR